MPPWLDTPEEAGAVIVGVLGVLGTIAGGVLAFIGTVIAVGVKVYRSKIKPILADTQESASRAAEQLTPNHGSSAHDSLGRIENSLDRLDRGMNTRIADLRADMRAQQQGNEYDHAHIFQRLNNLESPMEDTR